MRLTGKEEKQDQNIVGHYTNYFEIGYNDVELLIDFGQHFPETQDAIISSRIITSPTHAKILCHLLKQTLLQYEKKFGTIPLTRNASMNGLF